MVEVVAVTEMLERVALAIWRAQEERLPDFVQHTDPDEEDLKPGGAWDHVMDEARAAIKAMREPTDGMVAAGQPTMVPVSLGNGTTLMMPGLGGAPHSIYQRMIDAALK